MNYINIYSNSLYKQERAGAIGLRLTGVVMGIMMDRWTRVFKERLVQAEITIQMLKKYVDNVNMVVGLLKKGMR